MFRLGTSAAVVVVVVGMMGRRGKKKRKKTIRCNHWLQSCQTLFGTQAFIRCIEEYEYLPPERDLRGGRSKLSVHDITAALAVIRDDDVDLRVN